MTIVEAGIDLYIDDYNSLLRSVLPQENVYNSFTGVYLNKSISGMRGFLLTGKPVLHEKYTDGS
ncbi:hypothetical protein CALK_2393 [Chitinivibrio alkaliphilus ACht1]|uniref:Uncharacterized protein n=2 Tax=Chitinivibrio TaxID=1505231 RepID=U7D492_9BACT|nr:hypothetical protein CALK_2393 [Chitinivibrio alkaliphilus ACht1]